MFFRYFSALPLKLAQESMNPLLGHRIYYGPSFGEIAAFFGICVWLVPFGLFVSLSAGELTLPTVGVEGSSGQRKRQGLVKQTYIFIWDWIGSTLDALGIARSQRFSHFE